MNFNKTLYTKEGLANLHVPTYIFDFKNMSRMNDIFINDEWYLGRPDLLSLRIFETIDKYDYILKYNNIYNPFSLYMNQVFKMPFEFNVKPYEIHKITENSKIGKVKQQFIQSKRTNTTDNIRPVSRPVLLPPNMLKDGAKDIQITKIDNTSRRVRTL